MPLVSPFQSPSRTLRIWGIEVNVETSQFEKFGGCDTTVTASGCLNYMSYGHPPLEVVPVLPAPRGRKCPQSTAFHLHQEWTCLPGHTPHSGKATAGSLLIPATGQMLDPPHTTDSVLLSKGCPVGQARPASATPIGVWKQLALTCKAPQQSLHTGNIQGASHSLRASD